MTVTFYLRPTSNPKIGILGHRLYEGGRLIERKSYNLRFEKRYWDKKTQRVSPQHPDAVIINQTIESTLNDLDSVKGAVIKDPEKTPVLKVLRDLIESKVKLGKTKSTIHKYETILKNFRKGLMDEFGHDNVLVAELRDIKVVESIIETMKISSTTKRKEKYKTSNCLKNYLSFVAQAIDYFNARSGIVIPINSHPFRLKIGRDIQRDNIEHAKVFSKEDYERLQLFEPQCIRGKDLELTTKNTFLFQYDAGGLRWVDAVLLTNKNIERGYLKVRQLKTGTLQTKELNFQLVWYLRDFYPKIYRRTIHDVRVGDVKFNFEGLVQVQKMVEPRTIYKMNLEEIMLVVEMVIERGLDSMEGFDFLVQVKYELEKKVVKRFFKSVSELPLQFLLPVLKIEDFSQEELASKNFSKQSYDLIHRRRTNYNNCLARICQRIGIERFTAHSPRHTHARFLDENGVPENIIRDFLGHKHQSSTHSYLQNRHPKTEHEHHLQKIRETIGYR